MSHATFHLGGAVLAAAILASQVASAEPAGTPDIRVVGSSAAKELFFTARRFSAEEAFQIGLVNRVLPRGQLLTWVRRRRPGSRRTRHSPCAA